MLWSSEIIGMKRAKMEASTSVKYENRKIILTHRQ
jgi:hypothetical protein